MNPPPLYSPLLPAFFPVFALPVSSFLPPLDRLPLCLFPPAARKLAETTSVPLAASVPFARKPSVSSLFSEPSPLLSQRVRGSLTALTVSPLIPLSPCTILCLFLHFSFFTLRQAIRRLCLRCCSHAERVRRSSLPRRRSAAAGQPHLCASQPWCCCCVTPLCSRAAGAQTRSTRLGADSSLTLMQCIIKAQRHSPVGPAFVVPWPKHRSACAIQPSFTSDHVVLECVFGARRLPLQFGLLSSLFSLHASLVALVPPASLRGRVVIDACSHAAFACVCMRLSPLL